MWLLLHSHPPVYTPALKMKLNKLNTTCTPQQDLPRVVEAAVQSGVVERIAAQPMDTGMASVNDNDPSNTEDGFGQAICNCYGLLEFYQRILEPYVHNYSLEPGLNLVTYYFRLMRVKGIFSEFISTVNSSVWGDLLEPDSSKTRTNKVFPYLVTQVYFRL